MLSRREVESFIQQYPKFEDTILGLQYAPRLPKGMLRETQEVIGLARKFVDEEIRPNSLDLERKTFEDPDYLPWDLVKKANQWGFYTMWVPKLFGGKGMNMPSMSYFIEDVGASCLGITNVIGVHYLGVAGITASGNVKITNRILREVAWGEKTGDPCIIALAITEPSAGTDAEEVELADKGTMTCHAKRVEGGYVFNGAKIFISMGHVSKWTVLYGSTDLKHPTDTMVAAVVKQGAEGFSIVRHENKMGQRVCPASELAFVDCFVPDDQILLDSQRAKTFSNKPYRKIIQKYIDYIVSITRAGVGAMGAGTARGAFEEALKFAAKTKIGGKLMINQEWAQCMLAEMYKNVSLARLAYMEANYANSHRGIYEQLQLKPMYYYLKYMPQIYFDKVIQPLLNHDAATWLMSKASLDMQPVENQRCTSGWASLAKFTGTDYGVKNAQMALEMMGQTGLRHESTAEKKLRDAKLLQIYEGTNQLNRLNLFKCLIEPEYPDARVFED